MSWVIDIIVLAILAGSIILGYVKGLTKSLIKVFAFLIALVIAFVLFKPISNLVIKNTEIDDKIKNSIVEIVADDVTDEVEVKEDTNLPKAMVNKINKEVEKTVNQTKNTVVNNVAESISITAVNALVAIGLFIVARIALIFVSALSNLITDLPIIRQVDKIGGVALGFVRALIILFIIFAIVSFISPLIEGSGIIAAINKSILGSVIYNNNLLLNIIL